VFYGVFHGRPSEVSATISCFIQCCSVVTRSVVVQAASARGEGFMFSISDSDQSDDSPAGSHADDDDDDGGRDADRSRCTTS